MIQPDLPTDPLVSVEIEAVFPRSRKSLPGVSCKTTVFGGRVGFDGKK